MPPPPEGQANEGPFPQIFQPGKHVGWDVMAQKPNYHPLKNSSTSHTMVLTHCGPVTQICVYALQLFKMDDANLRF